MFTQGYEAMMEEIRGGDFGDPYAVAMDGVFASAAVALSVYGELFPDFHPALCMAHGKRPEGLGELAATFFELQDYDEATLEDLRNVHTVMSRYAEQIRIAGRSY